MSIQMSIRMPNQDRSSAVALIAASLMVLSWMPPVLAAEEMKRGKEDVIGSALPATRVVVAAWGHSQQAGHVVVSGSLRNEAAYEAQGVSVVALLQDASGRLLASGKATLTSTVLPAGRSTRFEADLPAVSGFASVKLQVRGVHLLPSRRPNDTIVTAGNKVRP